MSSTPQFTGEQLAAARTQHWHQSGDALLTLEAARAWLGEQGLVLFAPRGQQLATPAPSLVEATLGRAMTAATPKDAEVARGLVARLVAEGAALPLNLLGGPGDVPDFVVSAQVFSYVFTLRGDKLWKQAPVTSGAAKVSLLAAKVYEALTEGTALTAAELASELGREVTETAIVRALVELWAQLRVIPLLEQDGSATRWELTSRRFTKQIKAGANAGQPTALSALVSLYLGQALAATEEEIETFLSPLAARSRVRDVLHGLTAGRQLEPVVLEGKTLLYVPGGLPEFPEVEVAPPAVEGAAAPVVATNDRGAERIRTFDRPRKPREEHGKPPYPRRETERGRPARPFGKPGADRQGGERKSFGDRERRPFQKSRDRGERPSFTRPWDEERKPRERRPEGEAGERTERPKRAAFRPERKDFGEGYKGSRRPASPGGDRERRPFGRSDKPRFERREASRPEGERPERGSRFAGGERPAFRKGPRKAEERAAGDRPYRPRREEGFAARPKKTFGERRERPGFGEKRSSEGRPKTLGRRSAGPSAGAKPGFGGKGKFGGRPKFGGKSGGKPGFKGKRDGAKGGKRPRTGDRGPKAEE